MTSEEADALGVPAHLRDEITAHQIWQSLAARRRANRDGSWRRARCMKCGTHLNVPQVNNYTERCCRACVARPSLKGRTWTVEKPWHGPDFDPELVRYELIIHGYAMTANACLPEV